LRAYDRRTGRFFDRAWPPPSLGLASDTTAWRRGGPNLTAALHVVPPHLQRRIEDLVTDRDRAPEQRISAEAVETLVWLLDSEGVDRRRYRIESRLRSVRHSEEFGTLPEDLRERVRQIVAESER
jgi:hypothetical protein